MTPKAEVPRQTSPSVRETEIIVEEQKEGVPESDGKNVVGIRVGLSDFHDLEASTETLQFGTTRSATNEPDQNLVGWNGPNDPENPKNWKSRRKWAAALVVSSFTFITPVASAIVAPAFNAIKSEFQVCCQFLFTYTILKMRSYANITHRR